MNDNNRSKEPDRFGSKLHEEPRTALKSIQHIPRHCVRPPRSVAERVELHHEFAGSL